MSKRSKERRLLGQGTYGCGFYPALTCDDPKKTRWDMVGKVFLHKQYADEELDLVQPIRRLDPKQKLFLYPTDTCEVSFNTFLRQNARSDRPCKMYTQPPPSHLTQLLMKNGGVTLYEFLKEVPPRSLTRVQVLRLLQRVFYAIDTLSDNGLAHQDIKPTNIVLTQRDGLKMIDWGLLRPIADLYDSEKNHMMGAEYAISPPEYRYLEILEWDDVDTSSSYGMQEVMKFEEDIMGAFFPRAITQGTLQMYHLDRSERVREFQKALHSARLILRLPPGPKGFAPACSVDCYALGFLLLGMTPWLVSRNDEPDEVVDTYGSLVYGLMRPDPRTRMTISQALVMLKHMLRIAGPEGKRMPTFPQLKSSSRSSSNAPWMDMEQLFPTKMLPAPKLSASRSARSPSSNKLFDEHLSRFSSMTLKQLQQSDAYKEITPLAHSKSKLCKGDLCKLLATRATYGKDKR